MTEIWMTSYNCVICNACEIYFSVEFSNEELYCRLKLLYYLPQEHLKAWKTCREKICRGWQKNSFPEEKLFQLARSIPPSRRSVYLSKPTIRRSLTTDKPQKPEDQIILSQNHKNLCSSATISYRQMRHSLTWTSIRVEYKQVIRKGWNWMMWLFYKCSVKRCTGLYYRRML